MVQLTADFDEAERRLREALHSEENYDLTERSLTVAGRRAVLFSVDGLAKDEVLQKILTYLLGLTATAADGLSAEQFAARHIPYTEAAVSTDLDDTVTAVLSGVAALIVDGCAGAVLIKARKFPSREVAEPDDDRVLRGAHDGFTEQLISNTALIRRRIRDPALTMERWQIGTTSRTDVVVCYMRGRADERRLASLRRRLREIRVPSLTVAAESLAECLTPRWQWGNPFPKVRYTERPDVAAAGLAEGKILLVVDNCSTVMQLPTGVLDFAQDSNDFYFPPLVGTYLRFVRAVLSIGSLLLTPIWFLLVTRPALLPTGWEGITLRHQSDVPLLLQLLLIELMIDGVKLASLNTPGSLNNAFGVVGTLLLGDFAVQAGVFIPEALLYMSFVAVATFTQPSFELGYAIKLFRLLMLCLTALWGLWGLLGGGLLLLLTLLLTRTPTGYDYCYPLFPLNLRALLSLIIRLPITEKNSGAGGAGGKK